MDADQAIVLDYSCFTLIVHYRGELRQDPDVIRKYE